MAKEDKSFGDLVAEASAAPSEGAVSLVGVLAKSSEAGKFALTLQDGRTVTLETSAVKGHTVLGSSLGRTIVKVEVEAEKVPAPHGDPSAFVPLWRNTGWLDTYTGQWDAGTTDFWFDVAPLYAPAQAGGVAPFALATPQQAPANVLAALNSPHSVSHMRKLPGSDSGPRDITAGFAGEGDITVGPWDVGGILYF